MDRMEELYNNYGWYRSDVIDFKFEGVSGINKMKSILSKLRQRLRGTGGLRITEYATTVSIDVGFWEAVAHGRRISPAGLPSVDVLEYILEDRAASSCGLPVRSRS